MKIKFKGLILVIILIGLIGIFKIMMRPTSLYPYPYTFGNISYPDKNRAENCDILIVGDRMAMGLENLKPSLLKILYEEFSPNIDIFNWAEENEGLHRTLNKLSNLKKYPQIIIYQGASQEFYEKKFNLEQAETFSKNLKNYRDPQKVSLIMAFPPTSKFIYSLESLVEIGPILKRNGGEKTAEKMQQTFEMEYKIFELEMDNFANLAKEKNFFLFLLTTPINTKIPPKEICSNSTTPTLETEQKEIAELLRKGKSKEAFERVSLLGARIEGNAKNYYLLGLSLEAMGRFEEAEEFLNQGSAFDCFPWRSNIVFNNIIRSKLGERNIYMVDFDRIVNKNFGLRDLFLDQIFPTAEFYDLLGAEIAPMIGNIFKR
jgi:tetratricopeptide (TPR) repeat protein